MAKQQVSLDKRPTGVLCSKSPHKGIQKAYQNFIQTLDTASAEPGDHQKSIGDWDLLDKFATQTDNVLSCITKKPDTIKSNAFGFESHAMY